MHGVVELGVETIDTSIDIVLEELSEGRPESSGSSSVAKHQVEDLGGDALVDPLNYSEIIFDPTRIMRAWNGGVVDVRSEIAATKVNVEEMNPMIIIVFG